MREYTILYANTNNRLAKAINEFLKDNSKFAPQMEEIKIATTQSSIYYFAIMTKLDRPYKRPNYGPSA